MLKYLHFYLIFFSFIGSSTIIGQNIPSKSDSSQKYQPHIAIKKEYGIDQLIKTHESSFKQQGYRIQIFQGNKKQPAREAKSKYISTHSKHKAHEIYQQPYFKVRVGDFRTKLEALKFQKELISKFPNSFIVKDEIEIDELLD